MKKIPEVFSSKPLDVSIPRSWAELSPLQFKIICSMFEGELYEHAFNTILFLRLANINYIDDYGDDSFIVEKGGSLYMLSKSECAAAVVDSVAWVHQVAPIHELEHLLTCVHKSALKPDMSDASFGQFLAADSLYCGYLFSHNRDLVDSLLKILFPKLKRQLVWHRSAAVIWFSALKQYLYDRFPNLFSNGSSEDDLFVSNTVSPASVRESVDAMIRALTKGDVTIEEKVLDVPLYRALTELEQLAKEYNDFKSKSKS